MKKNIVARITNNLGIAFNVVLVQQGERYGLDDCLTHGDSEPMLEFYDATFAGEGRIPAEGKFVSRYGVITLSRHMPHYGLNLHGGVDEWAVDAITLAPVVELAQKIAAGAVSFPVQNEAPLPHTLADIVEYHGNTVLGLRESYLRNLREMTLPTTCFLSWEPVGCGAGVRASLKFIPVDTSDRSPTRRYRVEASLSWGSGGGRLDDADRVLDLHNAAMRLVKRMDGLTGYFPAT